MHRLLVSSITLGLLACGGSDSPTPAPEPAQAPAPAQEPAPDPRERVRTQASGIFGVLPDQVDSPDYPITEAKVDLGRVLYYETRLSKNHDISCNSCHQLDAFGVDGEPTSPGHKGQRGDRNSPTVYNAGLHLAQFWDGRAADLEAQAKGPILNPVEMAMADEASVIAVLKSIPGYAPLFTAAFPKDEDPITYDNLAQAIGAFERRLNTPSRFDAFLEGESSALDEAEFAGLEVFVSVGCIQCHNGAAVGGGSYQKLGRNVPYPTDDQGRFNVTGEEKDIGMFKVPSLRNIEKTGPYFHDGSIASLDEAVKLMAKHQLGVDLSGEQQTALLAFLGSLTGEVDAAYIQAPELPESGPDTPGPDPS